MIDVAIITPVFNTQDYLHRCINSVLEQADVSFQYFIVDDSSTDNSASIAQYYQKRDSRITLIRKSNGGQGVARNIGIKLAESEYVYFVDSDDYLGENTLSILYQTAKENDLDICSPNVPRHYFEKPLEQVSCLPCKSQFIRLSLIRKFGIFQPDIRSGQDGVFSHLVLTHCSRIGMASDAVFNYTHAREGSTFSAHLKRHHLVPSLLEQHYAAIVNHYEKFNLWDRNALRLLHFIQDESLKNRVDPHIAHFNEPDKRKSLGCLASMAKRAYQYLSDTQKALLSPALTMLATHDIDNVVARYEDEFIGKAFSSQQQKNNNIYNERLVVCKYLDNSLAPLRTATSNSLASIQQATRINNEPRASQENSTALHINEIRTELRSLRGKIDLAINSINNSTIQVTSAIYSPVKNLSNGHSDLVVSLTTLPSRLSLVHFAIESIFRQTVLPGKVVLWITDKIAETQVLTPELEELTRRGLEIRRVKDVGPHTKLIYALKSFPEKNIVTVDDDIVYPINALQCLWAQHLKFPTSIVCNWARELSFDAIGEVQGVRCGRLLTPAILESEIEQPETFISKPNLLAFPYGTSGVLYSPKSLNERVFDVDTFSKICPKEDDIWFKAMSLLNRTPVVVTNLGINPQHHCLTGSQYEALRHENHGLAANTVQMKTVFKYFDLYKFINE